jgi:hypothetical protein
MTLTGEDERSKPNAKPGLPKICVGCVVSLSRRESRKSAAGEQGIVSPANSSISSMGMGHVAVDGA